MPVNAAFIEKGKPLRPVEDYSFLRKRGIEHIEKLGSRIWTDYNTHDPGITILDMLCYAITDLGYRTAYPVEDILAEKTENGAGSANAEKSVFFTAREIMTVNPVTESDYRKVIIDVPGVKNAWLKPADPEVKVYIDRKDCGLTTAGDKERVDDVGLSGLYEVTIELEDDRDVGDLNRRCMRLALEGFSMDVFLPGWGEFFKDGFKPDRFEFTDIKPVERSRKYTAVAGAYKDGTLLGEYGCTIVSYGDKTEENRAKIEAGLNRTGKGSLSEQYRTVVAKASDVAGKVRSVLQAKRNICEDFVRINGVEVEEVVVCADVELTTNADLEETLSEIYFRVGEFLSPGVRFHTLEELFEKGKKADEVFCGPVLSHGFIDDDDLERSSFREAVHTSDIIGIIMSIPGVVAVKELMLSSLHGCEVLNKGERWCLKLGERRLARLSIERSRLTFFKGFMPYHAKPEKTADLLVEKTAKAGGKRLPDGAYDLPVPAGVKRHIQSYSSIQNNFPLCYGIGREGLPRSAAGARRAQAKQLKAYLLFYDRMLADYLSQLAHLNDIFTLDPEMKKTYFSHPLHFDTNTTRSQVPGIAPLIKEFVQKLEDSGFDPGGGDIDGIISGHTEKWQEFAGLEALDFLNTRGEREGLLEDEQTYEDRKNRVLDHMMARFAEQFTDYVLLMYTMDGKRAPAELIEDKLAFLADYPVISRDRFKAFDYKSPSWATENVSGLEKRVTRLLGMKSYKRRSLFDCVVGFFEIEKKKARGRATEYRFKLKDEANNILLSGTRGYHAAEDVKKVVEEVFEYGVKRENYATETTESGRYFFNLLNGNGELIARRIEYFVTADARDSAIDAVIDFIKTGVHECEGFHLVEHILLRPKRSSDSLLRICSEEGRGECRGFTDPYSFRVTAIVPYWPQRFRNMDFRRHFETTIRSEAPAHVHVKVCWVTRKAMAAFEEKYRKWLDEKKAGEPASETLKGLIEAIGSLRSVYPKGRLYDCRGGGKGIILLNQSKLGTTDNEG